MEDQNQTPLQTYKENKSAIEAKESFKKLLDMLSDYQNDVIRDMEGSEKIKMITLCLSHTLRIQNELVKYAGLSRRDGMDLVKYTWEVSDWKDIEMVEIDVKTGNVIQKQD
jgi:hypothetical protein